MAEKSCSSTGCTKESCAGCPSAKGAQKPQSMLAPANPKSHIHKVIGVVSGKGGVGKSLVTASLANLMKEQGYSVGILDADITGKNVLIVEDIIDTGRTLKKLKELLISRNPKKLKLVTLLDKPDRRVVDIKADYTGFTIPDAFVVGYGLDYAQKYRNLPYVGVLHFEE